MRLRHYTVIAIGALLVLTQACSRQIDPEPSCNFVMSSKSLRVSWGEKVPVKMWIDSSVPSSVHAAIYESVDIWNKRIGKKVIEIQGVTRSEKAGRDGYSVIYWLNNWEENRASEQARTTIYWTGNQIYEADIKMNDMRFDFSAASFTPPNMVDLVSVLVHEFGHVLGFQHTEREGSVMNRSLDNGVERREPSHDDLKDLRCEYV